MMQFGHTKLNKMSFELISHVSFYILKYDYQVGHCGVNR